MAHPNTHRDASRLGMIERITDGVAVFFAPANVGLVWGKGQTLVVDTANPLAGRSAAEALRSQTDEPVQHVVYTDGHVMHVGGMDAFIADAREHGRPRPTVWAHENVVERFERIARTRSFSAEAHGRELGDGPGALPREFVPPDRTYRDEAVLELAGERVELYHAGGACEDATWVWLPEREVALVGGLLCGALPSLGGPHHRPRSAPVFAQALEDIAERVPRFVVPGHGEPLAGDRALEVLLDTARALRFLHDAVVERLNAGRSPAEILDEPIALPSDLARAPHLAETHGAVSFAIRDVLRSYTGWWDGQPDTLMPAPASVAASDLVEIAGRDALLTRVSQLYMSGETHRALHLASLLASADSKDAEALLLQAELCEALANDATCFTARNTYLAAARSARAQADSEKTA